MKKVQIVILSILTLTCFGTPTKVTRIIDGDTIETETGEKVRLVGINAPEITDIFGQEAKIHLAQIIEGKTVDLVADNTANNRDRYNRLLRYIILNGKDINKQMVLDGYAFAYLKYHFDKEAEYRDAQLTASKNDSGIWNNSKNKETDSSQPKKSEDNLFVNISSDEYLIGGIIIFLCLIGCFYYYKK